MKSIFLIIICISLVHSEYSRDFKKEVVIDSKAKLMWQDKLPKQEMDWSSAVSYCEDLKFATYTDWRLPRINELNSIVDVSVFKNRTASYYWSSTTYNGSNIFAWHIRFSDGYVNINIKKDKDSIRCVRGMRK